LWTLVLSCACRGIDRRHLVYLLILKITLQFYVPNAKVCLVVISNLEFPRYDGAQNTERIVSSGCAVRAYCCRVALARSEVPLRIAFSRFPVGLSPLKARPHYSCSCSCDS
jgi:hypothetical protein